MPGSSGQPFGKYVLLDRIAAGGMAEIFRARYLAAAGVTKEVVIKRILPHYAGNHAFVSMFINEARIAVSLSHGNIAQVFDFGEIDGEYYLAMEHVHGLALSHLARRAAEAGVGFPVPVTLYVVSEVCKGLHYAHTRCDERGRSLGIVHRDISPQNILVGYEGEVKLVDFGIAKMRSASEGETQHGALKGKYVYFSPEQARAKPLDARSDVFSAGIVLYELLAGRRPFEGAMLEVLGNIAKGELKPPSTFVPLDKDLETIVMRALATRPEERYQTAEALHDDLQTWLHIHEPGFGAGAVGNFVRYLCQEELEADGITRSAIPVDFEQQLERWRLSTKPGAPPRVPSRVDFSWRPSAPRLRDIETQETVAGKSWLTAGRAVALGVALGLAATGATAAYLLSHRGGEPGSLALQVESTPPGASILVDGQETGRQTPSRIEGLGAAVGHEIELRLDGRRPQRTSLPPQAGPLATVSLALDDLAVPGALPPPAGEDVRDPIVDPLPAGPIAVFPASRLVLVAQKNALSIPASPAARMRLDPARSYRLSVEGVASLEGSGDEQRLLRSVFFFGERSADAPAAGSYGQIRPDAPVEVRGLRALYGFILDDSPQDNSGALKINVSEVEGGTQQTLLVDPARHFIASTSRLSRFVGLDPSAVYHVNLEGAVDLGASGGRVARLLYFEEAGGEPRLSRGGQGVLDPAGALRIAGARALWLLLPDDDPADNSGELTVTLEPETSAAR